MDSATSDPVPAEYGLVEAGLSLWPGLEGARVTLINISENHTFRLDLPSGGARILRLHRPGYQSRDAISSELAWLDDLANGTEIPVPHPFPGNDGEVLQILGDDRPAVVFAFEPGDEPTLDQDLTALFETLGRYAATLHEAVGDFQPPRGFTRPRLDAETLLDPAGAWGDWRQAPGVTPAIAERLEILEDRLRARLADYGTVPDRFGLIHADMRLANLLVDYEHVTLLDFDDCGYGWWLYDLAASLSFHETSPQVPALIRSWLTGYLSVRELGAEHIGMLDDMIMLRRLSLLAWIGSHLETETAQELAGHFAEDTLGLAERYLNRRR
ncbi:phosphotransferase enzyme family protein [Devosia sp.]|uniref:phosphotransferase enzyme family protein n=1 Tax=Devosia sp. TaxID=1871048 RepID=UPI003A91152F